MNTNKTIPLAIATIVIVIIGGVFMIKKSDTVISETISTTQPQAQVEVAITPSESSTTTLSTPHTITEVPVSVKPKTPVSTTLENPVTITPTASVKPITPTLARFTLAVVATHNSESDCWSVVNGGVYNLTSWISRHPGGSSKIMSMCGKDASALFNAQHGGNQSPEITLATFKIGTLSQ